MTPGTPDAPDTTAADLALEQALDEGRVRAARGGDERTGLWEAVAEATRGGKRFRPTLLVAAHDALGGTSPAVAARVAAAVELLHTAFVIHDDVIDGDDVRRGRLNPSGAFAARARAAGASPAEAAGVGRAAGILAGDLALTAATGAIARCGAEPAAVSRLLDLVDDALHTTATGELADVLLSVGSARPTLAESLTMEEQKTSAYSFALPLRAGAVLAGADDATVDRLGEAGLLLGVAFQLLDDLLGVFGDPSRTGKSATNDLRSAKRTPLLLHATSGPVAAEVQRYVGRDLSDDELDEARRLLTTCGSRRFVEELVESHLAQAHELLEELGLADTLLPALRACFPATPTLTEAVA